MKINKKKVFGLLFLVLFIVVLVLFFSSEYYPLIFIFTSVIFIGYGFIFLDIFQKHTTFEDPVPERYPSITILIPAHNEEESIAKTIEAVKKMKYPKKVEIIVLDDGSSDRTYEIIKKINGIKIHHEPKNIGKAAILNKGISLAKGEVVGNVDADTYPKEDVLIKMIGHFNDKNMGAVTTLVTVEQPKTFLQKLQQLEYYVAFGFWHKSLSAVDGLYVTPGPMSLYSKKALLEIGGYDEGNITEDMEIALNLKKHSYKIECCINSKVSTGVPHNWRGYFKQRLRWYRGAIYNSMFKHRSLHFNKKNKDFGYFIFPLFLATIFIGAALVFGIFFLNIKYFFNICYIYLMEILKGGFSFDFLHFDIFDYPSYYINFLVIAGIWGYFLYQSLKLDKEKKLAAGPVHFIFYLFFYSLVLSFAYLISIFYEFLGLKKKW